MIEMIEKTTLVVAWGIFIFSCIRSYIHFYAWRNPSSEIALVLEGERRSI